MVDNSLDKTRVGFPVSPESKKEGLGRVVLIFIVIIVILGFATWYLISRREDKVDVVNDLPTPTISSQSPTPLPTEAPAVKKDTLKIRVLNGTGIVGEAGKLESVLKGMGYGSIVTGNADNYNYVTTKVSFSKTFPKSYRQEITEKLSSIYSSVAEDELELGGFDAVIIVGKKGKTSPTPTVSSRNPNP
jgi:hypothetical protein